MELLHKIFTRCYQGESIAFDEQIPSKEIKKSLAQYLLSHRKEVSGEGEKTLSLLKLLEERDGRSYSDDAGLIAMFLEETWVYRAAFAFCQDELLCGALKNRFTFDMIEKIRFSKLQRKNLKDTASYNRHIEKALSEMNGALTALYELGAEDMELEAVLDKYFEFNWYVNTPANWEEFYTLSEYGGFRRFLASRENELLSLYRRSNLAPQSILPLLQEKNPRAADVFFRVLAENAAETPKRAAEVCEGASGVFDPEFLVSFCRLFQPAYAKEVLSYFSEENSAAAYNALCLAEEFYKRDEYLLMDEVQSLLAQKKNGAYTPSGWFS